MIKSHTIEEIKNRMDIYEVVNDFVQLKKSGSSYKALSPFTDEKTPSFMVSPSKGIFKCFSTGKGGDSIKFLMEVDGLSYIEALKYLAQKYGVTLEEEETSQAYLDSQNERESLFIILNFAKDHFVNNLWKTSEGKNIGLTYFKERGFSEEIINDFDLGYAKDQWQGLINEAKSGGYKEEYLEKAGLKIVKENKSYDRFRGRVVFPIHNVTGKVIAFGARTLKKDEKGPKYINSPETELYTKSKILYGIYQAKNEIRTRGNCYLVEGYTDVISLFQAGIKNVVASSGTSLTDDQIKLIKRYTDNVTVLFDGDKAGIKASMRGIDMMLAGGLNVSAVPFPEGEDPDSYSRQLGGLSFGKYLEDEAIDFISFKTKVYLQEGSDPIKRAESIREIVNSVSKIPDPIKRTVYIQECSNLLGVDESTLIIELNKLLIKSTREDNQISQMLVEAQVTEPLKETEKTTASRSEIIQAWERESMRMLINYGEELIHEPDGEAIRLVDYFISEIEDIEFDSEVYTQILQLYKSGLKENRIIKTNELLDHSDEQIQEAVIDLLSSEKHEISPHWSGKHEIYVTHESQTLKSSTFTNILRLKIRIIQRMISDNMEKIKSLTEESDIDKCLQIHGDLKEMEMMIAKSLGNVTIK